MTTHKPPSSSLVDRFLLAPVERRASAFVARASKNATLLASAYENQQGLSKQQGAVVRFMDWFPGNVAAIFVIAVVLFASLYTVITFSVGSHSISGELMAEIEAEKLRQLEAIHAADKAGDHDAYAKATLALEKIEASEQAPQALESALLSLISLVIAVTGIFSLPLITSATLNLMGTRLVAANAALSAEKQ